MKGVLHHNSELLPAEPLPAEFAIQQQQFTIYPFEENVLRCKKGTVITIEADALTFMSGIPITGKVEINVKEVYTKRDIILENLTTLTAEGQLDSIFMIELNATANEEDVDVQTNRPIRIELSPDFKKSWEGIMPFHSNNARQHRILWEADSETRIMDAENKAAPKKTGFGIFNAAKKEKTVRSKKCYLVTNRLGWINCARPFSSNSGTTELTIVEEDTEASVFVKVVLEKHGTVIPVFRINNKFVAKGVPLDQEINIVGIGKKEETYYFAGKTTLATLNQKEELNFKSTTIPAIRKRLRALR